jgi:hypothetical protein
MAKHIHSSKVGPALIAARRACYLSKTGLAKAAKVGRNTARRVEHGQASLRSFNQLADALGLELRGRGLPPGAIGSGLKTLRLRRHLSVATVAAKRACEIGIGDVGVPCGLDIALHGRDAEAKFSGQSIIFLNDAVHAGLPPTLGTGRGHTFHVRQNETEQLLNARIARHHAVVAADRPSNVGLIDGRMGCPGAHRALRKMRGRAGISSRPGSKIVVIKCALKIADTQYDFDPTG